MFKSSDVSRWLQYHKWKPHKRWNTPINDITKFERGGFQSCSFDAILEIGEQWRTVSYVWKINIFRSGAHITTVHFYVAEGTGLRSQAFASPSVRKDNHITTFMTEGFQEELDASCVPRQSSHLWESVDIIKFKRKKSTNIPGRTPDVSSCSVSFQSFRSSVF